MPLPLGTSSFDVHSTGNMVISNLFFICSLFLQVCTSWSEILQGEKQINDTE
jgi:hypothetical protein